LNKQNQIKKVLAFSIIFLFITTLFIPICIAQKESRIEDKQFLFLKPHFFGLKAHIKFDYDTDLLRTPIIPLTGEVMFPINVSYCVSGLSANLFSRIMNYLGLICSIELSIGHSYEWANIRVTPNVISMEFSTDWSSKEFYIYISVNEDSPAFETSLLKIKYKSSPQTGPFKRLTWVNSEEGDVCIPFTPGYIPIIALAPETNIIETPPGNVTELMFDMENLGNGLTIIESNVINTPSSGWWVYIQPETVLEIHEVKEIPLIIIPPEDFTGEEIITLEFTGRFFYDYNLSGLPYYATIQVFYNL